MRHRSRAWAGLFFVVGLCALIMILRSRAVVAAMHRLHRARAAPLALTPTALSRQAATSFGGPQQNTSACLDSRWAAHDAQLGLGELLRQRRPQRLLEVGCYVGYAAVQLSPLLGPEGRWYQVLDTDTSPAYVSHVQHSLRMAGLHSRVIVLTGRLQDVWNASLGGLYDLVLLAHWEDEQDALAFLEDRHALRAGTLVVADAVDDAFQQFAENYLAQVRDEERYALAEPVVGGAEVYRRL
eukprot:EG_transcript_19537